MTCACCEAIFICMDVDIYSWHAFKGRLLFKHIAQCTVIRTISDEQINRPTQCLVALLRAWMCDASNLDTMAFHSRISCAQSKIFFASQSSYRATCHTCNCTINVHKLAIVYLRK